MDIIFNCPKCEQELAVDSEGAGSEINCPTCGEKIVVPAAPAPTATPLPATKTVVHDSAHPVNPMSTSAAAKVEKHLKVPVHTEPAERLIAKPLKPLEVAARESDKRIRTKTIRHTDCIEVGHDKFDEVVTEFLTRVGEANIVSINPINYTFLDIGTQKLMTEYGVLVVYRG
jgi:DNA-directed RNA polymerase subunit RPC12/RpoP